ncbi:MAG: hypothetical protein EOP48_06795 [Sphingobacteriales bacterium]|nr:MAG: hypothetical protein EOP48_06795 [Sphingobacteriales bacterium]
MSVSITAYPANNGDSFLVSFSGLKITHVLIDGGYSSTYSNYIKHDLLEIAKIGGWLERLIVTHIDSDHISGVKTFLAENNRSPIISIDQVWHNSFRHFVPSSNSQLEHKEEDLLRKIIQRGAPRQEIKKTPHEISAEQGSAVGALLLQGKYAWNTDFNGLAVATENKDHILLDGGVSVRLLSPDLEKLDLLREIWKMQLSKYGLSGSIKQNELYDDAFELGLLWETNAKRKVSGNISSVKYSFESLLASKFTADTSPTNGSSIAFVLEFEGKKLLFTGDAHPDLICRSLRIHFPDKDNIIFDLVKVSHHGSLGTLSPDFLQLVDSKRYLFTSDGSGHGHPDAETIAKFVGRPSQFTRQIIFNYMTLQSQFFEDTSLQKKYNYSLHYVNKPPYRFSI